MNYIYYQTKTKFINTGDALINKALLDILRNYGVLKCNCSKEIPNFFLNELGIRENERIIGKSELSFVLHILQSGIKSKFNGNKVYIVSGLGHNYGGSIKKCLRNLIAGLLFLIYRIFNIKIIRIGLSLGPITNKLALTEKFRSIFINYYYVRDTKSLELCKKIGIKKANLCPDLSWIYEYNSSRKFNKKSNIVIVNLKGSTYDGNDEKYIRFIKKKCFELLKLINDSMNSRMIVKFIYQVAEDKDICLELYNYFKEYFNCKIIDKQIRLDTAKQYYGEAKYNISNRMHSILLGYKYGSLPIAMIDTLKHLKIQQTLKDCDLEELSIDVYYGTKKEMLKVINYDTKLYAKIVNVEKEKQEEIISILNNIIK